MQKNFGAALAHVLSFTDGWRVRPFNTSASTNYGITLAMLESHRGQPVSPDDLRALTKKETAAIYRSAFWDACKCGLLPPGIDLAVFDCAVAVGPARAVRLLQEALDVKADGLIGADTLAAATSAKPRILLASFLAACLRPCGFWQRVARLFSTGHARRLAATCAAALSLMPTGAKPRSTQTAQS